MMIDLNADLDLGNKRLPFLATGTGGCNYGLELAGARQWVSKKDRLWHSVFEVIVLEAQGEGATPVGTRAAVLIKQEPKFNYHVRDLQNIGKAITGARLTEETYAKLLPEDGKRETGFKGARFLAQVSRNDKGFIDHRFFDLDSAGEGESEGEGAANDNTEVTSEQPKAKRKAA